MSGQLHITLQLAAAPKPAVGTPCNGCGVCCSIAPCPLSRGLLGHRAGACPALVWQENVQRYVCGLVVAPADHLHWLPHRFSKPAVFLAQRWISAGTGCDCDAEESET